MKGKPAGGANRGQTPTEETDLTRMRLIAVAAVASLAIAGCGGGDDESNSGLSYSELGQEMDKICTEYEPKFDAEAEKIKGKAAQDAPVWDELVRLFEEGTGKFKALDPPSELQADFDNFISLSDQQLALTKEAQAAAKSGDQQEYASVAKEIQQSTLDEQSDEAASKLGAAECIEDSSGS